MPGTRFTKRAGQLGALSERFVNRDGWNVLHSLSERINRLGEEKSRLTLEETEQLLKLYSKSGTFLKKRHDAVQDWDPEEASLCANMMKKLKKDYTAMSLYHKRLKEHQAAGKDAEPLTIEQFYDISRTRTLSLDGRSLSEMKQVGDGVNVRYVVPVPYKNEPVALGLKKGDTFHAYFTENESYDPEMSGDEILVRQEKKIEGQILEKYPVLKGILGARSEDRNSRYFNDLQKLNGTKVGEFLRNSVEQTLAVVGAEGIQKALFQVLTPRSNAAKEILNKINAERDQEKKNEMLFGFIDYTSSVMKTLFAREVRRGNGMSLNSAMGKRNALMSDVAELFGCDDVLAYSEKVNIRTLEKGKEVTRRGVIMMPAAGEDMDHAGTKSQVARLDRSKLEESPELTKKVASLQFLDLLCGNTDRHRCNFFYQFDAEGKLTGIQGIDNDSSFGTMEKTWRVAGYAVDFDDLKLIPKSMADKVKKMDKDTFGFFLHGYDLTQEEIDTAVKRFDWIKRKLESVEKAYQGVEPGALAKGTPRIVPDEEMHLYSYNEQLMTNHKMQPIGSHNNLFTLIKEAAEDQQKSLLGQITIQNRDMLLDAYSFTRSFAEKGRNSLAGNMSLLKQQNAAMDKKDKSFERMIKDTEELLSSPRIWQGVIKKSSVTAGKPEFGGSEIFTLNEGRSVKGAVPKKEATLSRAVREVLDTELYKKMDKALESTYAYLSSDAAVAVAEKYQLLQIDLKDAPKAKKEELRSSINQLKESDEFKRYMAAVKNRDKLQEQMDRYVKLRETSDELLKAAARYDDYFNPEVVADPYKDSPMQQRAVKRKNEANEKAKQQIKMNAEERERAQRNEKHRRMGKA